jgi:ketosteroid isomerase-like protein
MPSQVVRKPIGVKPHSRRRPLDVRLLLFFPGLLPFVTRAVLRLPLRSRVRQAFIWRYLRIGIEAANRGDLEAAFSAHHPKVVANFDDDLVSLGFEPAYMSRDKRVAAERRWTAEWSDFRYEPEELTDLGDGRLFVVGRMKGRGKSSGAVFDHDWSMIITISGGHVIREQVFFDRERGLEATGVSS